MTILHRIIAVAWCVIAVLYSLDWYEPEKLLIIIGFVNSALLYAEVNINQ